MAVKLGMKNVNQAIIFDLLTNASTWAEPIRIDEKLYWWVSRQYICRQLELLSMRPDTAYRHLKGLAELKLIDYQKEGKKDCIAITELGRSYIGNKSEKARKEIRKDSEKNPTYNTFSDNTTNNSAYTEFFEKWWDVYPNGHRQNKKKCFAKWIANDLEDIAEKIINDVLLRIKESKKWKKGYIPLTQTYLNQDRWTDDIDKDYDSLNEEAIPTNYKTQEENVKAAKEEEYRQYLEAKNK